MSTSTSSLQLLQYTMAAVGQACGPAAGTCLARGLRQDEGLCETQRRSCGACCVPLGRSGCCYKPAVLVAEAEQGTAAQKQSAHSRLKV